MVGFWLRNLLQIPLAFDCCPWCFSLESWRTNTPKKYIHTQSRGLYLPRSPARLVSQTTKTEALSGGIESSTCIILWVSSLIQKLISNEDKCISEFVVVHFADSNNHGDIDCLYEHLEETIPVAYAEACRRCQSQATFPIGVIGSGRLKSLYYPKRAPSPKSHPSHPTEFDCLFRKQRLVRKPTTLMASSWSRSYLSQLGALDFFSQNAVSLVPFYVVSLNPTALDSALSTGRWLKLWYLMYCTMSRILHQRLCGSWSPSHPVLQRTLIPSTGGMEPYGTQGLRRWKAIIQCQVAGSGSGPSPRRLPTLTL